MKMGNRYQFQNLQQKFYRMCVRRGAFLALKKIYRNDAYSIIDCNLFCRLRVKRAFKADQIQENELQEPAYLKERKQQIANNNRIVAEANQIIEANIDTIRDRVENENKEDIDNSLIYKDNFLWNKFRD